MSVELKWEPHNEGYKLVIHVGKLSFGILSAEQQEDRWEVVIRLTHWTCLSADEAAALVADHIATLDLPCPLPPFPGSVFVVVATRVATMQAAGLCPRGGEIVDYTIGLCSCMECPTPRPGWVAR